MHLRIVDCLVWRTNDVQGQTISTKVLEYFEESFTLAHGRVIGRIPQAQY